MQETLGHDSIRALESFFCGSLDQHVTEQKKVNL